MCNLYDSSLFTLGTIFGFTLLLLASIGSNFWVIVLSTWESLRTICLKRSISHLYVHLSKNSSTFHCVTLQTQKSPKNCNFLWPPTHGNQMTLLARKALKQLCPQALPLRYSAFRLKGQSIRSVWLYKVDKNYLAQFVIWPYPHTYRQADWQTDLLLLLDLPRDVSKILLAGW